MSADDGVFVSGTVVTREMVDSPFGPMDVVYLSNPDAPEDMQHVVAGRVLHGSFQFVPLADFAVSPKVLRDIADLIEIKALPL